METNDEGKIHHHQYSPSAHVGPGWQHILGIVSFHSCFKSDLGYKYNCGFMQSWWLMLLLAVD
jgi:hypothetical protein